MPGAVLVSLAFLTDAACVGATHSWPIAASTTAVYLLLALAWCLSIAAYVSLRSSGDGGGGSDALPPDPDPPWWPEFERQFRDYSRGGPRRREPVA